MADSPPPVSKSKTALEADGTARRRDARMQKSFVHNDLKEAYFFAAPNRMWQIQSYDQKATPQQGAALAAELNTDLAFELCGDFATEVINAYMPESEIWCRRSRGPSVPQEAFDKIKDQVEKADDQIFLAIRASNFYSEFSKAADPDLSIGAVALWIQRPRMSEPIVCSALPIHEFDIRLGPYGEIDDRFVTRFTENSHVRSLVGEDVWEKVPEETKKLIADKPTNKTEIWWGFWRLWDRHEDEVWQYVTYVGKQLVHDEELRGEGCCPMVVMRWNPSPDFAWSMGPLRQTLPTLRQVDELEIMRIEHAENSARPPIGYPDDSFAAIENGFEPNMAYPIRVGSEGAIKPIYNPPPADAANYQYEEKEHRLRKLFYVDFPQQSGDTPPTASQWLDEMARAQRRIGRPGLSFWNEGPAKIFTRFKYLLEENGSIPVIKIDDKNISLLPYNPTQRAAEQQEIAMAVHGLQLCAQFFPEEFKVNIDGKATMKALLDKLRVKLVVFRDPEAVKTAVDQISKLLGGQAPGAQNTAQAELSTNPAP